jgi:plasmid stabilization system protein ParE
VAKTLRFNRRVPDDACEACAWYAQLSESLAERFLETLEEAFELVASSQHAKVERVAVNQLRAWQVPGFPGVILYRVDRAVVVIEAIGHAASDLASWRKPDSDG